MLFSLNDNKTFKKLRPALAARNGVVVQETTIPDGFYVVGNHDLYENVPAVFC